MQVNELLGLLVRDRGGAFLGTVIDLRLTVVEDATPPEVCGVLVSPRSRTSYLGYERSEMNRPRALSALLRWHHRDTFLLSWSDVARVDADAITVRDGYERQSPMLRSSDSQV